MFELVPSEYIRTILKEEGFTFTDFQKAALIWNAPSRSKEEKREALRELMGQTEDAVNCQTSKRQLGFSMERGILSE